MWRGDGEDLGLFFFFFFLFSDEVYAINSHYSCLVGTVQMRDNNMCLYWRVERLPLNFPQNLTLYGAPCNEYVEVYSDYFNQSDYTN